MASWLAAAWLGGCAGTPPAVLDVASQSLRCPRDELEVTLNRETHTVREYAVGCNFMYTRVHCTTKGCVPAEVEPPCIGKMPCFEEDPETLTWHLASAEPRAGHAETIAPHLGSAAP